MNNALVTFRPLGHYFFGSEATHGNGEGANYFAIGNPLPQQTTLLGTLRHLLFLNYGNDGRGLDSFNPDDASRNNWGYVQKLSPLFLRNGAGHFFLRQALDRQPGSPPLPLKETSTGAVVFADYTQAWLPAYKWKGYEKKKGVADEWVSSEGIVQSFGQIFRANTRPGIPKKELYNKDGKVGPGLYKQTTWRLEKDWSFCVMVDFSLEVDIEKINDQTLPMGGEKTVFHISVEDIGQDFETLFSEGQMFYPEDTTQLEERRIVLIADAMARPELLKHTIGGSTEAVDFRHIRTHIGVQKFGPLKVVQPGDTADNSMLSKSTKFTLFRRGSVFVCADDAALSHVKKSLDIEPWQSAGFNRYFVL